jgi:hypothetical protein
VNRRQQEAVAVEVGNAAERWEWEREVPLCVGRVRTHKICTGEMGIKENSIRMMKTMVEPGEASWTNSKGSLGPALQLMEVDMKGGGVEEGVGAVVMGERDSAINMT